MILIVLVLVVVLVLGHLSSSPAGKIGRHTRDAHAPVLSEFAPLLVESPSKYDDEHEYEPRLMPEDENDDEDEDDWGRKQAGKRQGRQRAKVFNPTPIRNFWDTPAKLGKLSSSSITIRYCHGKEEK